MSENIWESEQTVIVGDIHYNEKTGLLNEYMENGKSVLLHELDKCLDELGLFSANKRIFLGDVFHTSQISQQEQGIRQVFDYTDIVVQGNHDFKQDGSGCSALDCLESKIIKTITFDEEKKALYVPYTNKYEEAKIMIEELLNEKRVQQKEVVAFMHADIKGVYQSSIGFELDWLKGFKRVFDGHLHNPLDIGNVHIVGSVSAQNFSDNDKPKRFMTYDWEHDAIFSNDFAYGFRFIKQVGEVDYKHDEDDFRKVVFWGIVNKDKIDDAREKTEKCYKSRIDEMIDKVELEQGDTKDIDLSVDFKTLFIEKFVAQYPDTKDIVEEVLV